MTTTGNERKNICQMPRCLKIRERLDQYVDAYNKKRAENEALQLELTALRDELVRTVENSKKAVLKARAQQRNSKERAERLSDKLKKLEGVTA